MKGQRIITWIVHLSNCVGPRNTTLIGDITQLILCRYNKYVKTLCRDSNRAQANLAKTTQLDAAANFAKLIKEPLYDMHKDLHHTCTLTGLAVKYTPPREIVGDLRMMASNVADRNSCVGFRIANILGVHFRAGEWGTRRRSHSRRSDDDRCGSVVTVLMGRRSLFARVLHFFRVIDDDNPGYAHVEWFSEPEYLYANNPLGVRCREDGREIELEYGNVVRITQIDPSQIMVEHEPSTSTYIMIRDSGYNTRP